MRASAVVVTTVLLALAQTAGCGGGVLSTSVEAPPVEVRAVDDMHELHFRADANVSAAINDGEVLVRVHGAGVDDIDGQVRVTLLRGADVVGSGDVHSDNAVVPCHADNDVDVRHDALAGCDGACSQEFVAVFAGEGLPGGSSVSLPVTIEATLVYDTAAAAPPDDSLTIVVE